MLLTEDYEKSLRIFDNKTTNDNVWKNAFKQQAILAIHFRGAVA